MDCLLTRGAAKFSVNIIGWWKVFATFVASRSGHQASVVHDSKIWVMDDPAGSEATASHFCCLCLKARRS